MTAGDEERANKKKGGREGTSGLGDAAEEEQL